MEAHDDQTVNNRTWWMVAFEAPFSSLTFQEVLAFHQIPHSLSKAPLVEGGNCDMRGRTWCKRVYELVSATRRGKRRIDSGEYSKRAENKRIQWPSNENSHTYIRGMHTEYQTWVLQPAACTIMPGPTKFLGNVWNKAGYSRAGKVKGPFLSSFRPITSSREYL